MMDTKATVLLSNLKIHMINVNTSVMPDPATIDITGLDEHKYGIVCVVPSTGGYKPDRDMAKMSRENAKVVHKILHSTTGSNSSEMNLLLVPMMRL